MGVVSNGAVETHLQVGNTVTADFTWLTDVPADSSVVVTPLSPGNSGNVRGSSFVLSHSLQVTGLTPGIEYSAVIASADGDGSPCSYDPSIPDGIILFSTPPPFVGVTNVRVEQVAATSALLLWSTTVTGTTEAALGPNPGALVDLPRKQVPDSTDHSYLLTGLTPEAHYAAKARSFDNNNLFDYLPYEVGDGVVEFDTLPDIPDISEIDLPGYNAKAEFGYHSGRLNDLVDKVNELISRANTKGVGGGGIVSLEFETVKQEFYYKTGNGNGLATKIDELAGYLGVSLLIRSKLEFGYDDGGDKYLVLKINEVTQALNAF